MPGVKEPSPAKGPMGPDRVVEVAVDSPAPAFYSYLAPPGVEVLVGQMVRVPFRGGELLGYVMRPGDAGQARERFRLKTISEVVVEEPLFGPELAALVEFVSGYYLYPPGLCVKEILPGGLAPRLKVSYGLTGDGLRLAAAGGQPGQESLDLLLGAHPDPLSSQALSALRQEISRHVRGGLVEAVYGLDGRSGGFSYEWFLSAVPEAAGQAPPRLGARESELLELARGAPPTPLTHYRQIMTRDPLPQARSLARKGLLAMERRERFRDDPGRALSFPPPRIEELTPDQAVAVGAICGALEAGSGGGFLLFGVTGSGKTEVYLRAAETAIAQGRGVLWLAPEIALTMGLEGRLRERFPGLAFSVLHSALTSGQRHDHWVALRRGRSQLALGARSAVFAPIADLGLIIVDEEHDWAYKQDEGLRYNGRDLAAWRARESGSVLVLGSATPSLESYQRARQGHLGLLRLQGRPGRSVLPEVRIVDLRGEAKAHQPISGQVRVSLKETFGRGEQALMFINRRGLASLPMCLSCGTVLKCPHCSLALTLHSDIDRPGGEDGAGPGAARLDPDNLLVCHGCGYRARPPRKCAQCGSPLVRYLGAGTESLMAEIEKSFGKRGLRLDTDSSRRRGGLKDILESFARGGADFLVGTQMAAKGHDFSNLTLVGVVEADLGLNVPDFRAAERTFQLLSQVSGRAGRRERPGTVFIQTRNPGHYAMTSARDHDYEAFFESEIAIRRELGYPPFARMALVRLSGREGERVEGLAQWAADLAREHIAARPQSELELFGPAPCPMARLREKFRHQMMLRAAKAEDRHALLRAWLPEVRRRLPAGIAMTVDVDPYNLL
ncbi:MAG: primosomal protein N' [Deltaproteobacteria bacterium]|nr:primosomal protein N' [Deltaproteobacteria bacterium]